MVESHFKTEKWGTSLVVQSLRLGPSNARGQGFIPDGRTRVLHAALQWQKKKKKKKPEKWTTDINSTQSVIWSNENMLNLTNPVIRMSLGEGKDHFQCWLNCPFTTSPCITLFLYLIFLSESKTLPTIPRRTHWESPLWKFPVDA